MSEAMNILVTFAVQAEFSPWQRRRNFQRLAGDWPVYEAEFGGAKVRAILTGMGQRHALEAIREVLRARPDICVSTGLAGALRTGYHPGDILAARLVSEVGEPVAVASHRELLSTALECGARQVERFATSKTLVARVDQKRALASQADAVEMESYTILAEAARYGVPALAVRAISDTAEFEMPYDFDSARDARGHIRASMIAAQVLRRPLGLPSLLTLARDCRVASKKLANFLDVFAGNLADRLIPIEQDMAAAR